MSIANLTREGLDPHELAMLGKMQDAISDEAHRQKPTLEEMLAWADDMETRERNALHRASCVNGYVPTAYVRSLANARALIRYLEWSVTYREDVETLFRAKQHAARRRQA